MGAFLSLVERRREGEGICEDEGLSLGGMGCSKLSGLLEKGRGDIEVGGVDDSGLSGKRGKWSS